MKENSAEFVKRYQAANAQSLVKLIVVPDQGHNVWPGFFRCQKLIDFAIARAKGEEEADPGNSDDEQ